MSDNQGTVAGQPLPGQGRAHLWLASTDRLGPEERPSPLRRSLLSRLSAAEHERLSRYLFAKDRDLYLLAHGLLRSLLSAYHPAVAPRDWRFSRGDHGKPALCSDLGIELSLSHAGRRAAILVTRSVPCGVDIEPLREVPHCIDIAERFFAAGEHRAVREAEQPDRRFLELWTAKEACAKSLGLGLQMDLSSLDLSGGAEAVTLPSWPAHPIHRHGFIDRGYSVAVAFVRRAMTLSVFDPLPRLFGNGLAVGLHAPVEDHAVGALCG
jgi:4'-phosphopantetheinyl transferase